MCPFSYNVQETRDKLQRKFGAGDRDSGVICEEVVGGAMRLDEMTQGDRVRKTTQGGILVNSST